MVFGIGRKKEKEGGGVKLYSVKCYITDDPESVGLPKHLPIPAKSQSEAQKIASELLVKAGYEPYVLDVKKVSHTGGLSKKELKELYKQLKKPSKELAFDYIQEVQG